jgi:hypothetical protein
VLETTADFRVFSASSFTNLNMSTDQIAYFDHESRTAGTAAPSAGIYFSLTGRPCSVNRGPYAPDASSR